MQGVVHIIADFNTMIQAFKDLNILNDNAEQTFMQLTDYPHLFLIYT